MSASREQISRLMAAKRIAARDALIKVDGA
jgi:hypothetical protein